MLTVLALFSQVPAHAQGAATGTLQGVVKDPSGAVIEGALVRIVYWRRMAASEMAIRTDTNGQFKFELPPGVYDLFVSSPAFRPVAKQVNIKAGKDTVLNPNLEFSRFFKPIP